MHLDPRPSEDNVFYHVRVDIARLDETTVGSFTQTVVKSIEFGPPEAHERKTIHEKVTVNWETPQNHHVINAYSETGVPLSFTLAATKQSPLSDKSVLIAALIMVFVYVFILLEVIHRTLVSIFGSMVALFFFFLMHNGETESIKVSLYDVMGRRGVPLVVYCAIICTHSTVCCFLSSLCRQSCYIRNGAHWDYFLV